MPHANVILPYEPGYTGHWEQEKRRKETREWLREREAEVERLSPLVNSGPHLTSHSGPINDLSLKKSGRRRDDYCDVIANGAVVGRIMLFSVTPDELPWMWTIVPRSRRTVRPPTGMRQHLKPQCRRSRGAGPGRR